MTLSRLHLPLRRLAAALLLGAAGIAAAQTTVTDPWLRATVAQQKASGMFAVITSAQGGKLVAASSPVAGLVEIHTMAMEAGVMRMRELAGGLPLAAGQAVKLEPGGVHLMLMDLKQQLVAGQTVPLTLVIEGPDGKRQDVALEVPVRALGAPSHGGHGGMKH